MSELNAALTVIEGMARREHPTELHNRVAETPDGDIWIDRGTPDGSAIRVTSGAWGLVKSAPVVFRRSEATGMMPEPISGDPVELGRFLNVTDEQLPLVIGWLVAALIPNIPHPTLALRGLQGSGKSEAERLLVTLVDPSPAPLRSAPTDQTDWVCKK